MRMYSCHKTHKAAARLLQGCCKTLNAFEQLTQELTLTPFARKRRRAAARKPWDDLAFYCTAATRTPGTVWSSHDCRAATLATVFQLCKHIWRQPCVSSERKTIVRASNGCLTFSENHILVCNFFCNLPHGLSPAVNRTAKRSYDWCATGLSNVNTYVVYYCQLRCRKNRTSAS